MGNHRSKTVKIRGFISFVTRHPDHMNRYLVRDKIRPKDVRLQAVRFQTQNTRTTVGC